MKKKRVDEDIFFAALEQITEDQVSLLTPVDQGGT